MHIGVPKEIKNHEYRVGLTPSSVREIIAHGHKVSVETGAGGGIGASDDAYASVGANVLSSAEAVFATADMIVKVKEPQPVERALLRDGQILFTYLHLAPDPLQCADLLKSNAVCIAYETVTQQGGGLPLLAPMSEVAGRMSIQAGAYCLERAHGGKGILLGGVAGVPSARIVILGGGVVGSNAAQIAVGTGAQVVVVDRNVDVLRRMDRLLGARVITVYSNQDNIEQHVLDADLVIGGVLVPGAAAPKLITRELVESMRPGSAIVDVAIDQGGCCETARATTHAEPTFKVGEIVHYCVANMPGGVPRTSTYALNNATWPFVLQIADKGWRKALSDDEHLRRGLNVAFGKVTCREVAEALGYTCEDAKAIVGG
jgi:alanine dehydrogenase